MSGFVFVGGGTGSTGLGGSGTGAGWGGGGTGGARHLPAGTHKQVWGPVGWVWPIGTWGFSTGFFASGPGSAPMVLAPGTGSRSVSKPFHFHCTVSADSNSNGSYYTLWQLTQKTSQNTQARVENFFGFGDWCWCWIVFLEHYLCVNYGGQTRHQEDGLQHLLRNRGLMEWQFQSSTCRAGCTHLNRSEFSLKLSDPTALDWLQLGIDRLLIYTWASVPNHYAEGREVGRRGGQPMATGLSAIDATDFPKDKSRLWFSPDPLDCAGNGWGRLQQDSHFKGHLLNQSHSKLLFKDKREKAAVKITFINIAHLSSSDEPIELLIQWNSLLHQWRVSYLINFWVGTPLNGRQNKIWCHLADGVFPVWSDNIHPIAMFQRNHLAGKNQVLRACFSDCY